METQFKSLLQVLDYFKDEATCVNYLAQKRWGDAPACPHCGNVGAYITNRGYKCKAKECGKKFTVTTGTTFENTKISLRYWFAAMYLCTAHKKGISSLQLSRDLNITQKTAWFLLHRIREMLNIASTEILSGTVEVDETYIGGKAANIHKSKKHNLNYNAKGSNSVNKAMVVGLKERGGNIIVYHVPDNSAATLKGLVYKHVGLGSEVVTDEWRAYSGLQGSFQHKVVNHKDGQYVKEGYHTNTVEGFWGHLKRMIKSTYHRVSPKHLSRYCDEQAFRYNTRDLKDTNRFEGVFKLTDGKRLTYAKLIS
jgi:transposase-like protein